MRSARVRTIALATFAIGGATLASVTASRADDMRVVLARTGTSALVLWNASPVVADIVTNHRSDAFANDALERGALRAASLELRSLSRAKTIAVRVLYDKTGAVSPVYGEATFAGVERYAIVQLDGARARSNADRWQNLGARDAVPKWIAYRVVGSLPPR